MQIATITTRYDAIEDRILLAVADADDIQARLWLTRRMTQRLVAALVDGVQRQIAEPPAARAEVKVAALAAANVYAQLQARISKKPAPPVEPPSAAPQHLIQEIGVRNGRNGARILEFRCRDRGPATLMLSLTEQRQWLESLKSACGAAHWALDVWPGWMAPGAQDGE
ncbi:conserved hypothetical protein [Acidovorax sp. JS42]|nr:conserved hypothetical protein [Acidovorax sp. JS42]